MNATDVTESMVQTLFQTAAHIALHPLQINSIYCCIKCYSDLGMRHANSDNTPGIRDWKSDFQSSP
jgi:hypothetical protein